MGRVDYGLETGRVKEKEFFLTVIKLVWCMSMSSFWVHPFLRLTVIVRAHNRLSLAWW